MQIGMIGLGKMGGNMSRRLMKAGHHTVVFALSPSRARHWQKTAPPLPRRLPMW